MEIKNNVFFRKDFLFLYFGNLPPPVVWSFRGDRTMVSYLHTAYCNVRLWRNQFFSPQFNFWAVFCLCFFSHVNGIG